MPKHVRTEWRFRMCGWLMHVFAVAVLVNLKCCNVIALWSPHKSIANARIEMKDHICWSNTVVPRVLQHKNAYVHGLRGEHSRRMSQQHNMSACIETAHTRVNKCERNYVCMYVCMLILASSGWQGGSPDPVAGEARSRIYRHCRAGTVGHDVSALFPY